jgi:5-methylcytosine-specific restriction protein A
MSRFDADLRGTPEWGKWEDNKAHQYAIERAGKRYPVKQIVSMATGFPVSEFSGGKAAGDANEYVRSRGLSLVQLRPRNPKWTRDELILALDMYLRYGGNPPGKESAEISELSRTLNHLARYLGLAHGDRFRNINGVYMKLMNFRRFDPAFRAVGKVGLARGGGDEEEVWAEFAHDSRRCSEVAAAIRQTLANAQEGETIANLASGEAEESEEGRVITAIHRRHERDVGLVKKKKAHALATTGRLECEACGFDFRVRYGARGEGFIECHHTQPVHQLKPGDKTRLSPDYA